MGTAIGMLTVARSVYGDLNWYLQSRTAPAVRPRPLQQQQQQQQQHRFHSQQQQQPSSSFRAAPAPPLQHSTSAYNPPPPPHSSLREGGAEGRGAAVLFSEAKELEGEGEVIVAVSEAPAASVSQVNIDTQCCSCCTIGHSRELMCDV
jgi:hypothetical protein